MAGSAPQSGPYVKWRWTVRRWRSDRSWWGVEFRRRPRLRHSQVRLHVGTRHLTLSAHATGRAHERAR